MDSVRAEVTVEPFVEGQPGPHVLAAIAALQTGGLSATVGPFGTAVEGPIDAVADAVREAMAAAFAAGATGVSISAEHQAALSDEGRAFLDAISPGFRALGAAIVDRRHLRPTDQRFVWKGEVVGGARLDAGAQMVDTLPKLISQVEAELGGRLAELDRPAKQRAARRLEELGAFTLRNAIETVSEVLGVSRATLYNYLNARNR